MRNKHTENISAPPKKHAKKRRRLFLRLSLLFFLIILLVPLIINSMVIGSTKKNIRTADEAEGKVALILGAKAHENRLSDMLRDRMETGIALFKSGAVDTLLLSGDGTATPSETAAMRDYALAQGIPADAIFTDDSGFSTYESLAHAKAQFGAEKLVIVTQRYHLYRALYIGKALGIEAVGVDAALESYAGQWYREIREIAARCKDFLKCL